MLKAGTDAVKRKPPGSAWSASCIDSVDCVESTLESDATVAPTEMIRVAVRSGEASLAGSPCAMHAPKALARRMRTPKPAMAFML